MKFLFCGPRSTVYGLQSQPIIAIPANTVDCRPTTVDFLNQYLPKGENVVIHHPGDSAAQASLPVCPAQACPTLPIVVAGQAGGIQFEGRRKIVVERKPFLKVARKNGRRIALRGFIFRFYIIICITRHKRYDFISGMRRAHVPSTKAEHAKQEQQHVHHMSL